MKLKNSFRTLSDDFVASIIDSSSFTLILISKNDISTFATSGGDKRRLMERCNFNTDILLMAWAGNWKTDIFILSESDVKKQLNK